MRDDLFTTLIQLENLAKTDKMLLMNSITMTKEVMKLKEQVEFLLKDIKEEKKIELDKAMKRIEEIKL